MVSLPRLNAPELFACPLTFEFVEQRTDEQNSGVYFGENGKILSTAARRM